MAVLPDDKVYISYLNLDYDKPTDMSGTPTVLRVVSSQDGGKTFLNSTVADHSACQCCSTVVKFGPQNDIYVTSRSTFQNNSIALTNDTKTDYQIDGGQNQTIIRDITVSHSTDGPIGQNFTTSVQVGNDRWFMNGCPDAGPGGLQSHHRLRERVLHLRGQAQRRRAGGHGTGQPAADRTVRTP